LLQQPAASASGPIELLLLRLVGMVVVQMVLVGVVVVGGDSVAAWW
jgi:hypothetical protein